MCGSTCQPTCKKGIAEIWAWRCQTLLGMFGILSSTCLVKVCFKYTLIHSLEGSQTIRIHADSGLLVVKHSRKKEENNYHSGGGWNIWRPPCCRLVASAVSWWLWPGNKNTVLYFRCVTLLWSSARHRPPKKLRLRTGNLQSFLGLSGEAARLPSNKAPRSRSAPRVKKKRPERRAVVLM